MSGLKKIITSIINPDPFVGWAKRVLPNSAPHEHLELIYYAIIAIVFLLLLYIAIKIMAFLFRKIIQVYVSIKAFFAKRKKKTLPEKKKSRKVLGWLRRIHELLNPEQKPIEEAFHESSKLMKLAFGGHDYMYELPWYLAVGDKDAGKTSLLNNLNIKRPFGLNTKEEAFGLPISWHYFDYGVMLDVKGGVSYSTKKKASTSRIWTDLLQQLSYHRPRRPLDGIVVALSAEDLYGEKKLSTIDMRQKAHVLYQQLISIQNTLSMRLPVYVVITKTDTIPGFDMFAKSFPSSRLSNIFGWSAPHSMQQHYSASWMVDAQQEVMGTINDLKLQAFTMMHKEENHIDPDALFVFSEEFGKIWENISVFVNQLFAENIYKDPHFLRGVYFTGVSQTPPVETNDELFVNRNEANVYFSRDLFVEKIFRERNIAFPSYEIVQSIWRNLTVGKITMIGGLSASFLFAWWAHNQLRKSKDEVLPVAHNIKNVIEEVNESRKNGLEPTKDDFDAYKKHFDHFLKTSVDDTKFWALFIPPSWFSNYKEDTYAALGSAFDVILVQSVHKKVQQKLQKLLEEPKGVLKLTKVEKTIFDLVDSKLSEKANPSKTKYFKRLKEFTDNLVLLEKIASSYNNFFISRHRKDLFSLIKNLFEYDLDKDFKSQFALYNWSIRSDKHQKLDLGSHKQRIQHNFEKLFDDFLVYGVTQNESLRKVFGLNSLIDELSDINTYPDLSVQDFESISKTIKDVIDVSYKTGDLAWIAGDKFDPGEDYTNFLIALKRSKLIGRKFVENQSIRVKAAYAKLKEDISGSYSTLLGSSVFSTKEGVFSANKELIEIKKFLDRFSDESFMVKVEKKGLATKEVSGKLLLWDSRQLANADKILSGYYEFVEKGIEDYPQKLRPLLEKVAKVQLHENLMNLLGAAQYTVSSAIKTIGANPEEHYKSQSKSFGAAWPHLKKILGELTSVDEISDEVSDLMRFISDQFIQVLVALDHILDQEKLLRISAADFKRWDGDGNPILRGFRVNNFSGLEAVLDTHSRRLSKLAKDYAKPSVNLLSAEFLPLQSSEHVLVRKWSSILNESLAYEKKKSDNSVEKLINLYTSDLKEFKLDSAGKTLAKIQTISGSGDYFIDEREKVLKALDKRVDAIGGYKLLEQYQKIADYFNRHISGRYPFSGSSDVAQEVDMESLKGLFKLMNKQKYDVDEYISALKARELNPSRYVSFISQLNEFRQLFKAFSEGGADMPSASLQIHFHALKQKESPSAKNLIDQEFDFGTGVPFDISDNGKKTTWSYGDPINVIFKLAEGSSMNVFNSSESESSFSKINNQEGMFSYDGGWALFRMLRDLEDRSEKGMLQFNIPIETRRGVGAMRTFVRIILQSADEKQGLILSEFPKFPARAPNLSEKVLKSIRSINARSVGKLSFGIGEKK